MRIGLVGARQECHRETGWVGCSWGKPRETGMIGTGDSRQQLWHHRSLVHFESGVHAQLLACVVHEGSNHQFFRYYEQGTVVAPAAHAHQWAKLLKTLTRVEGNKEL